MVSSTSAHIPIDSVNYDEESLIFSDSLKDLKNLRTQLYSAAEYFELSYTNDSQKQIVVDTLKDYTIKAIVNTVDHLGSATYKVNDLLEEKVEEVSGTELRVSCIEQRIRSCQQHVDLEGCSQQSLVINTPKYHKQYILPVVGAMTETTKTKPKYHGYSLDEGDAWHQLRKAVRSTTIKETPSTTIRKSRSSSPFPRSLQRASTFVYNGSTPSKVSDKRAASPHRLSFIRSSSLSRPTTPNKRAPSPNPSRTTISNIFNGLQQYPSATRKSATMARENPNEIEHQTSKSKGLLKSLLSRRKSRKDDMLYTYLDEY